MERRMSEEILKSIEHKLNAILKILALQHIEKKPKEDQANILLSLGMTSTEVANILGKSPSTIRVQRKQKADKKKIKEKIKNSLLSMN